MPLTIRLVVLLAAVGWSAPSFAADPDWNQVGQALGRAGAAWPGGVYRVGLPRTDLKVSLDGVPLKPSFALGGWVAFESMGSQAMVMGDLVLTEEEINPVMARLLADGITITALHNHLLRAQPPTFYMHVVGQGDAVKLATAIHDALGASKTPLGVPAASGSAPAAVNADLSEFDTAMVEAIIGRRGAVNGGVVQFSIPRADTITDEGMPVPPAMGTAVAVNFQPTANGKAAITGDFVLLGAEVNPVLQALRQSGIEVTALHNHMLDDQPHTYYVHFWANDDAGKLARGIRMALDKVNLAKG